MTDDGRFTDSYSVNRELRIESRRSEPLDPADYSHLATDKKVKYNLFKSIRRVRTNKKNSRLVLSKTANETARPSKKVIFHTSEQFELDVWLTYEKAARILIDKHSDYGPKNVSQSPGGPLNGLRVRMWDKIARINNLIESGKDPKHESLRDSFLDLLNYSAIALLVIDGKWPNE